MSRLEFRSEAGRLNEKGLVIGVVGEPSESVRPMAWTRAGGLVEFAGTGAHVAGEGAFMSAPGAGATLQKHAARATFAFLGVPGQPQKASVRFNTVGLHFESTRIAAQSVDGSQVRIQGSGAVNGKDGYEFTLSAGKPAAGGSDRFHIRIVQRKAGARDATVVYDNQPAATSASTGEGEGSVVEPGATLSVQAR